MQKASSVERRAFRAAECAGDMIAETVVNLSAGCESHFSDAADRLIEEISVKYFECGDCADRLSRAWAFLPPEAQAVADREHNSIVAGKVQAAYLVGVVVGRQLARLALGGDR